MTLMQRDRENLERGARMMQLRYMGKSYEEIAKIMDTNATDVSTFLKKYETFDPT